MLSQSVIRAEVSEVQFGLYSDADIRKLSCCHVVSPVAFDTLGNPINSGLYDPRLGPTTQYGPPCVTCGLIYMNCPGHPGHIELCVPVYHPLLFAKMFALLRAQCANCLKFRVPESKIRVALIKLKLIEMGMIKESNQLEDLYIPPSVFLETGEEAAAHTENIHKQLEFFEEKYNQFIQINKTKPNSATANQQREVIDAFQKLAVAVKKCDSCGSYSPSLRKDGYTKLFEKPLQKKIRKSMQGMKIKLKTALERMQNTREIVGDDSDEDPEPESEDEGESTYVDTDKYLAPIEVEARMKLLWQYHPDYLNFIWQRAAISFHPSSVGTDLWSTFFIRAVLVPPSRFRPPADLGNIQSEHPQNLHLSKILSINEKINQIRTTPTDSSENDPQTMDISKLVGVWIDLQNAVNCFIDATKDQNVRPDEATSGIRQLLEKKEGLFRRHMMGKRVNFCCRSVISPDPFLGMNEIGIPVQFAKELHYPTPVTSWNVKMLRQMVENGPSIYPGIFLSQQYFTSNTVR